MSDIYNIHMSRKAFDEACAQADDEVFAKAAGKLWMATWLSLAALSVFAVAMMVF